MMINELIKSRRINNQTRKLFDIHVRKNKTKHQSNKKRIEIRTFENNVQILVIQKSITICWLRFLS
jgi:hypothetical protein